MDANPQVSGRIAHHVAAPAVLINAISLTHGGGRTYVVNLLRELNRDPRGLRFSVLAVEGRLAPEEVGSVELLPVRIPAALGRLAVPYRVLYELLGLPLRASGFDLVYCPADFASPLSRTACVLALRNLNIYDRRFYDDRRLRSLELLASLAVGRARRVVFPSQAAADQISRLIPVPRERIAIVPHGIAAEAFEGARPAPSARRYVFAVSSLERHKNLGVVIRSLAHLSDRTLEVWIAGPDSTDPGHARELRELARDAGVGERVRFLGLVPYREVFGYYCNAEAFVFPSLLETFGHPLLEAMLAGTPVIASDLPVFREIAGDAALYFPPEDPVALAAAIAAVGARREETGARTARGRERALSFSWRRSVDRLCQVFDEVLEEARAAIA